MIPWLEPGDPFPDPERSLREPNGLLCAGGDLSIDRLLAAYRRGIFPWFNGSEPILWWSPDPRMVLYSAEFKVPRSLGKSIRNKGYEIRIDTAFGRVLAGCAGPRRPGRAAAGGAENSHSAEDGTWLGRAMRNAYAALYRGGYAHSFETWLDGELVGGLYGVALGRMFYGESMFSHATDASKVALAALVDELRARDFPLIDCQVHTDLLQSLGAREIPRTEFLREMSALVNYAQPPASWRRHEARRAAANP